MWILVKLQIYLDDSISFCIIKTQVKKWERLPTVKYFENTCFDIGSKQGPLDLRLTLSNWAKHVRKTLRSFWHDMILWILLKARFVKKIIDHGRLILQTKPVTTKSSTTWKKKIVIPCRDFYCFRWKHDVCTIIAFALIPYTTEIYFWPKSFWEMQACVTNCIVFLSAYIFIHILVVNEQHMLWLWSQSIFFSYWKY